MVDHGGLAGGDTIFRRLETDAAAVEAGRGRLGHRANLHGQAVALLADAALALARGEALQRRQAFRPDTSVDDYLLRCSLKTGKLFEASCLLGGGREELGEFGLSLGIAFQIVDDILDCAGDFDTTGKAPGVDLRDGTPTRTGVTALRRQRPTAP